MKKEAFKSVLTLLIIAVCCGAILGIVKSLVGTTTTNNEYLNQVFAGADSYILLESEHLYLGDYADVKNSYITTSTLGDKNGVIIIESVGQGFEGDITLLTAFDNSGLIVGIICTDNDESRPSTMLDQATLDKLLGLNANFTSTDFDGTAGATYTTNGILDAVNTAVSFYNEYNELLRGSV